MFVRLSFELSRIVNGQYVNIFDKPKNKSTKFLKMYFGLHLISLHNTIKPETKIKKQPHPLFTNDQMISHLIDYLPFPLHTSTKSIFNANDRSTPTDRLRSRRLIYSANPIKSPGLKKPLKSPTNKLIKTARFLPLFTSAD